jgi:hypothetical protein
VVPRASGQLNENVAFVKRYIWRFEVANGLYDKRGVIGRSHDVFVTSKEINIVSIFILKWSKWGVKSF